MKKMVQPVNPEMLILARESRGFTQNELAKATSISQGNISKYESGLLSISEEHLTSIASVLRYPEAFFRLAEQRFNFGSSCTYHRKRQTMPVHDLKILLARSNILRINVARLLTGVEIETENLFQRLDVADYDGDVEEIARLVRKAWHLPFGPINNLVGVIEDAGAIVYLESFGTRKLDAISQWIPSSDPSLPPIFLINSDMPGERIRFTLAHELGHVIMHRIPTDNMEAEADRFAAEFLMPAHDIAPDLRSLSLPNLARLKSYWKVSMAAIIRRASDLGKITPRQYRTLNEQMSRQGYKTNEPYPLSVEKSSVLDEIIDLYHNEFNYSVKDLANLTFLLEEEVQEKFFHKKRGLYLVSTNRAIN